MSVQLLNLSILTRSYGHLHEVISIHEVSQASLLVPPLKGVLFLSLAKLIKVKIQLNNFVP